MISGPICFCVLNKCVKVFKSSRGCEVFSKRRRDAAQATDLFQQLPTLANELKHKTQRFPHQQPVLQAHKQLETSLDNAREFAVLRSSFRWMYATRSIRLG